MPQILALINIPGSRVYTKLNILQASIDASVGCGTPRASICGAKASYNFSDMDWNITVWLVSLDRAPAGLLANARLMALKRLDGVMSRWHALGLPLDTDADESIEVGAELLVILCMKRILVFFMKMCKGYANLKKDFPYKINETKPYLKKKKKKTKPNPKLNVELCLQELTY